MAKDEKKKGKGFFSKVADAISGNTDNKPEDQSIVPPVDNGAGDDVIPDQGSESELKNEVPVAPVAIEPEKKKAEKAPRRSDKKAYLNWLADKREERSKRIRKRI